ncbi:MAG: TniQ family protein [Pseudonocardia sp.]
MTAHRPLPRSLDPLPDESIVGFVLRLAHRLDLTPARVVTLTGLNTGHHSSAAALGLTVHVVPAARDAFAHATKLTPAEIYTLFLSALGDSLPGRQTHTRPEPVGQHHLLRPLAVHPFHSLLPGLPGR